MRIRGIKQKSEENDIFVGGYLGEDWVQHVLMVKVYNVEKKYIGGLCCRNERGAGA